MSSNSNSNSNNASKKQQQAASNNSGSSLFGFGKGDSSNANNDVPANSSANNNSKKKEKGGLFGFGASDNNSGNNNNKNAKTNSSKKKEGISGMSTTTIVTTAILLIILIIVIIYTVYRFRQNHLESVSLLDTPMKLYGMTQQKKLKKGSEMSQAGIGQEFTYSLWLYIVDYDDTSSEPRLVMVRNDEEDTLENANPIIYMDGRTNRMYISVRTNKSDHNISDLSDLVPSEYRSSSSADDKHYLTATIEYIPLQRWVNVTVVVQDNLLTAYLDGEMYTVRNVHDIWKQNGTNRPIISASAGDVYVGPTSQNNDTVRGFISGVKFFNYALMTDAIAGLYTQGPNHKTLASRLGWERRYGFQSPIYRLDNEEEE